MIRQRTPQYFRRARFSLSGYGLAEEGSYPVVGQPREGDAPVTILPVSTPVEAETPSGGHAPPPTEGPVEPMRRPPPPTEDEQPGMRKPPPPSTDIGLRTAVFTVTAWKKIRNVGPYVVYGRWYSTSGGQRGDYNQFVAIKENQTPPKGAAKRYADRFATSQEEAISKAEEMGDQKEGLTTGAKVGLGVAAAAAAYFMFMR